MKKLSIYLLGLLVIAFTVSAINMNIQCPATAKPGSAVSCNVVLASAPTSISEYSFTVQATGLTFSSYSGFPTGFTGDYNTAGAVSAVTGGQATASNLGTISLTAGSAGTGSVTVSGVSMSDYDFNTVPITVIPATITIQAAQGPICGQNGCEAGETCSSCEADCGPCTVNCTEADWTHSNGACQSSNTLIRTWTKTTSCTGGVSHPATESVACTYVPPSGNTIGAQIDAGLTQEEKTSQGWTTTLISKIANILRNWFSTKP